MTTTTTTTTWSLSDVDLAMPPLYVNAFMVLGAKPDTPSFDQLVKLWQTGLSLLVADWPILAGFLSLDPQNRLSVTTRAGASVSLTANDLSLDESSPSLSALTAAHYAPSLFNSARLLPAEAVYGHAIQAPAHDRGPAVLYLQANRIAGDGIILAIGAHHCLFDAGSINILTKAWADKVEALANGRAPTSLAIDTNRARLNARPRAPSDPESAAAAIKHHDIKDASEPLYWQKWSAAGASSSALLSISLERLAHLKSICQPPTGYVSSLDCLTGLVWRAFVAAKAKTLGLDPSSRSRCWLTKSFRGRGVPEHYLGNAANPAAAGPTSCLDLAASVRSAASDIRGAILEATAQQVVDRLSLAKSVKPERRLEPIQALDKLDMQVTSWSSLELERYGFALGGPLAFRTPAVLINGLLLFYPRREAEGRQLMALTAETAVLREMMRDELFAAHVRVEHEVSV